METTWFQPGQGKKCGCATDMVCEMNIDEKKNEKILIVDDEPGIRLLVDHIFRDEFIVIGADSAEAGIQSVIIEKPDVVLLDVVMRGQSGIDALAGIRKIDPALPVIMITGSAPDAAAGAAEALGADAFLLKPFHITDLKQLVHDCMGIRRLVGSAAKH